MTPAAILALIKDLVIVVAIGLVAYFLISYGKDIVKISDMKAVTKQLADNTAIVTRWQKESTDADTKHVQTLQQIGAAIDKQRAPVFVRQSPGVCPVPNAPAKAGDPPNPSWGTDQGRGIDYRPAVNQFELKYETALADCYAALDKYPQ